jgi:thiol-disulfide isomerase/thioredoxin
MGSFKKQNQQMKKTTIILLLAVCQFAFSQTTQIEAKLKGIQAKSIQGEKLVDYDMLKHIKNKVVILEFWETWCGPCIEGMPHLKELKDKFPNDLQIICISSDDVKKTSSFISEHSYPFDYIFDAKKQLSAIFPHSSIPHSVIIDKKGKIQVETFPGYLTPEIIKTLISTDSIDVPAKNNFDPHKLESNKTEQSLLLFDLKSAELGDRSYTSYSISENKKRIVTSYNDANAFRDTVETIQQSTFVAKNILQLYSYAFNDLPEFRFIFPKELDYVNSHTPNNRYKLNYSLSSLFGDYHSVMIRQLNAAFGLETERVQIDTTVLVLKKVLTNGKSIKLATKKGKSLESNLTYKKIELKGNSLEIKDIANLIENKTLLPVDILVNEKVEYELNIKIESVSDTLEDWLSLFEKEGIFLVKEKKKTEFIRIKKVCP